MRGFFFSTFLPAPVFHLMMVNKMTETCGGE